MTTEYKRMQQLRGTSAQWTADNIVPLDGEVALERAGEGIRLKVGDGVRSYAALEYIFPQPSTAPLGSIDAVTTAPPAGAVAGDFWVNTGTGNVAAGWGAPAAGLATVPGDHLMRSAAGTWSLIPIGGDLSGYAHEADLAGIGGAAMIGWQQAGTGAVPWTVQAKLREQAVSVMDFYQVGDGANYQNAMNRACATGKNVYVPAKAGGYPLSDGFTQHANGNVIFGDGPGRSFFICGGGFNMAAPAVMTIPTTASENAAGCTEIGFVMGQPDTAVRASMISYPPVIQISGVTRPFIGNVRISGAQVAIDARGNCGGLIGGNWEIGTISATGAVRIDGAKDTINIQSIRFWPYGLGTANQLLVYGDGQTCGLEIGYCDGFHVGLIHSLQAEIRTVPPASEPGKLLGNIGMLLLDSHFARLTHQQGNLAVGSAYFTTDNNSYFVKCTGTGVFICLSWWSEVNTSAGTVPLFECSGAAAKMHITNGVFGVVSSAFNLAAGRPAFKVTAGTMDCSHNQIVGGANVGRTVGFVEQTGGRLIAQGMLLPDPGSGTGPGIKVATNEFHCIGPNQMLTWAYSLPATRTNGIYVVGSGTITAA